MPNVAGAAWSCLVALPSSDSCPEALQLCMQLVVFRFILPEDGSLNVPANASIRCEDVSRASQCLLISESDLWPAIPCSRSERWAVRLPPDSRVHLLPAVALQDWLKIEQLHRQEILSRFQPEVVVRVEMVLEANEQPVREAHALEAVGQREVFFQLQVPITAKELCGEAAIAPQIEYHVGLAALQDRSRSGSW